MKKGINRTLLILGIILALVVIAVGIYLLFFRPDPKTYRNYKINYDIQGYLFNENKEFIEDTTFTARNPHYPTMLRNGEVVSKKSSFECIRIKGFPIIDHESGLSTYTRNQNNNIRLVQINMGGSTQDEQTGSTIPTLGIQYILYIDKKSNELLLCHIIHEVNGETEQYYFSPQRNPDHINDILIRAYTT